MSAATIYWASLHTIRGLFRLNYISNVKNHEALTASLKAQLEEGKI